jgi:hypothetical protein
MKKKPSDPPEDPEPAPATKRKRSNSAKEPVANADGMLDTITTSGRAAPEDAFRDLAPPGGVLIGFRYWKGKKFGGNIAGLAPIYRVGTTTSRGKVRGKIQGPPTDVSAKAGYAVGAVEGHSGVVLDSLVLVFMKVDGEKLDPSESYKSPALGKTADAHSRRIIESDGRIVRGVLGEIRNDLVNVGLVLAP